MERSPGPSDQRNSGSVSDNPTSQKKKSQSEEPKPKTPDREYDEKPNQRKSSQMENVSKLQKPAPSGGLKGNMKAYLVLATDKRVTIFVMVIWSVEVWKTCMDALLFRQMRQEVTMDQAKLQTAKNLLISSTLIALLMFAMGMIVYYILDRKVRVPFYGHVNVSKNFKYFILLIGLSIHLGWCAISWATILFQKTFVGLHMMWMGFAWYFVHPIRFLLIFHQKIPMEFLHSHMLVTFNVGLITLAVNICNIFLASTEYITATGFSAAWGVLIVLGIAWIVGIFLIRRYRNPVPEDLQSVRRLYQHTEALPMFDSKQTLTRQLILIALLVPGVILAFTRATVSALLRHMAVEAGNAVIVGLQDFRADLIIAFVTVITVEAIIIFVHRFRNDVFELFVIGIAHALYIIVLVLIAVIIEQVRDIQKETPRRGQALVEIYLCEGNSNTAGYVFRDMSVEHGVPSMAKFLKRQIPMNDSDESLSLRIFNKPFGDLVSLSTVTLESGKFQLFHMVQTGNLMKITKPLKVLPTHTFDPQVYVLNSIKECHEYDVELASLLGINLTNARGIMFTGGVCAPVEVSFHVMRSHFEGLDYTDLGPDLIKEVIRIKPPGFEGISSYYTIPCQYPPLKNNSYSCVTVFQGYYKMFEYYSNIGKPFPSPERQAFKLESLKPYSINPRRIDYLTKPHQLINALNTISFRNVEEFGLEKMGFPILLHGMATGIGTVSYIHLIWRQAAIPHRALLVYGYFGLILFVESIIPLLEAHRVLYEVAIVYLFAIIEASVVLWHVIFATKLYRKMSESAEKYETPSNQPLDQKV